MTALLTLALLASCPIESAVKSGDDVVYSFCDGARVRKRPDGSMGLSMALGGKEYDAYTADARANLEVAEHNAQVLNTSTARERAARARAAFQARVDQFVKRRWSKERYYAEVKKSNVPITER